MPSLMLTGHPVDRRAMNEQAADQIRVWIVGGLLRPGDPLDETKLCETLSMSRTPLREAFKLLAAQGLVELRQNRGAWVAPIRSDEIRNLFEALAGIERLSAELAAIRGSAADLRRLGVLQERLERCAAGGKMEEYFRINQQLHDLIVQMAGNPVLQSTHAVLLGRAERARFLALHTAGRWQDSIAEHRAILEALTLRDPVLAGQRLDRHVMRTGEAVLESLVETEPVP